MEHFEHDPVTDETAYQEMRRFFTDLYRNMKEKGSSPMRIATATRLSRSTLEHYFLGVQKGQRFRITEDAAKRLAHWANLNLEEYRFGRVPVSGFHKGGRKIH